MAPYLTPTQLRSVPDLADTGRFPDALLAGYVAEFETIAENYRGVAFTPRTAVEVRVIEQWTTLASIGLTWPLVTSITSVVVDGTTVDSSTYQIGTWDETATFWYGLVGLKATVTYVHGYATPPELVLSACRQYVRSTALEETNRLPRETISQTVDGVTFRLSTPGPDRPTGFLAVDRKLNMLPDFRAPGIA